MTATKVTRHTLGLVCHRDSESEVAFGLTESPGRGCACLDENNSVKNLVKVLLVEKSGLGRSVNLPTGAESMNIFRQ